jgi:hypothetical protein
LEVVDILRRIVTAIEIHPCPERGTVDIKVTDVLAEILAIAHRARAYGKQTRRTAMAVAGERYRLSPHLQNVRYRVRSWRMTPVRVLV